MSKYPLIKLGEVATIVSGSTPKTNVSEYWDGEYNWVTPAELNDDVHVIYETERKISEKAVVDTGLKLLPKGTVLLSSRAPIGKVAIAGTEMYCNQGFKNLICSDRIYNKYLFWFLKGKTDYLNSLGRGATFKEISKAIVEKMQIPLPPLETQKQIAKTLDTVSELLSLRKQQLLKLDNLTKSIFYDMFGDLVTNEKGWNQIALGEVGTFKNGINYSRNKSGFSVRCLGVGDFKDLLYIKDVSHLPFIELPELPSQEYLLQNGDIVFVRSNGNKELIGRCIEIFPGEEHVTFSGFCIRYRITVDCLTSHYLNYALHVSSLKKKLLKDGRGCNIQNINQQTLSALSIPVPPIELQNEFTMIATKIEDQKNLVQKSIQETQLLFDSLMSQYFDE